MSHRDRCSRCTTKRIQLPLYLGIRNCASPSVQNCTAVNCSTVLNRTPAAPFRSFRSTDFASNQPCVLSIVTPRPFHTLDPDSGRHSSDFCFSPLHSHSPAPRARFSALDSPCLALRARISVSGSPCATLRAQFSLRGSPFPVPRPAVLPRPVPFPRSGSSGFTPLSDLARVVFVLLDGLLTGCSRFSLSLQAYRFRPSSDTRRTDDQALHQDDKVYHASALGSDDAWSPCEA